MQKKFKLKGFVFSYNRFNENSSDNIYHNLRATKNFRIKSYSGLFGSSEKPNIFPISVSNFSSTTLAFFVAAR